MYEIIQASLADAKRLLGYKREGIFGAGFSLKGFDYPWIIQSRKWKSSDKILDVGAGYSPLPVHLADTYGCEVWAVDDFGLSSDEPFWTRNKQPEEHARANPQVKFVFERLGDPAKSSLPLAYFDCIYSASSLEHVPPQFSAQVWAHMARLLKPGGEMIHAIDIKLPTHRGLVSVFKALLLENLRLLLPASYRVANAFYTPGSYISLVNAALGANINPRKWNLGVTRMIMDPEIVLEPLDWTYNRIVKDGMNNPPILRVTTLCLHIRKGEA